MSKRLSRLAAALTLLLLPVVAAGCGGPAEGTASGGDGSGGKLSLVAYSTPKEAYGELIPAFTKTVRGQGRRRSRSPTARPATSRARSPPACPPTSSRYHSPPTSTSSSSPGIVDANWTRSTPRPTASSPTRSSCSPSARATRRTSRPGTTSIKPGVEVITPNPFTSGGAKWNLMAAYGAQIEQGKSPAEALDLPQASCSQHVPVQDKSAREALQTFAGGKGDVADLATRTRRSPRRRPASTSTT